MALYGNTDLTGVERTFDRDDIIVSKTDTVGKMTYGNRTFFHMAGFTEKECLGVQHNLIRHPHMPRCVFDFLWKKLQAGDEVFAYVVNRSKNGDHYWVFAHVTPSVDLSGKTVGYHSTRRVPNRQVVDDHIVPLYKTLLQVEQSASSPSHGLAAGNEAVARLLTEHKVGFNELMFSLGT